MCSQIAVAVAVDGLPTHAATDLFNLSQLNRSSLIVKMSDLASDDQIAHQISENSDQQHHHRDLQVAVVVAVAGAHTRGIWSRLPLEIAVAVENRCRGWGPLGCLSTTAEKRTHATKGLLLPRSRIIVTRDICFYYINSQQKMQVFTFLNHLTLEILTAMLK